MSLRDRIDARYRTTRGLDDGLDPDLTDREVLAFVVRKGGDRLRGLLRGMPRTFVGSRVSLRNRHRLRLGRNTSIGPGVLIDALSREGVVLDDDATIDRGAVLRSTGAVRHLGVGIRIGRRAAVGASDFIHGGGGVDIGRDVLLGPFVQIFSENHLFDDPGRPIIEQSEIRAAVTIGDDVWVGAGAIILAGVTIGEGAVVAAGAVVRFDVPPRAIVAGIPARVVGSRGAAFSAE
jgi:acetyltransferase-like isoleucine patch superfamily enzyme